MAPPFSHFALVLALIGVSTTALSEPLPANFVLVAHRGVVTKESPENSLAALDGAIQRGYTHVEVDLRCTKDGHVVVAHDDKLKRAFGDKHTISKITLERLRKIAPADLLPTFEEFCARAKGRVGLMPDLKEVPKKLERAFLEGIERTMRAHDLLYSALFIGADPLVKHFCGKSRIALRGSVEETRVLASKSGRPGRRYFVFGHAADFTQAEVDAFHAMGLSVVVSINVNHYRTGSPVKLGKEDVQRMLALGVDGLQLDAMYDEPVAVAQDAAPLRFRADGQFRIVQFTDVHWQNGEPEDLQSLALMTSVLDTEKPDLVVLTGDILGGGNCRNPRKAFLDLIAPLVERKIPWAYTFGNHDDECPMTRGELLNVVRRIPGALAQPGPSAITGLGNYAVPVYARDSDRAAATLYCLDSNSYTPEEDYDWIHEDQIAWYLETAKGIRVKNGGAVLPALAFFHIPLPEYENIWAEGKARGSRYEPVSSPKVNSGFFAALRKGGDVLGTFVGHDHVNDYEGELEGIRLCYGRASGYQTYGEDGFLRGARVIELTQGERSFRTWHRLADGTKLVLADQAPANAR
jgi:glycerophosphoryl diester phosphodiesterase family protein/calcineurin-like phosphoesterase family protein